jgi:hypothetical protein
MHKKYVYSALLSILCLVSGSFSSFAQSRELTIKEMLSYKNHGLDYIRASVVKKGYVSAKVSADKQSYSYVMPGEKGNNLHTVHFEQTPNGIMISYGTTNANDNEQLKNELKALHFDYVRTESMQFKGHAVPLLIYKEGKYQVDMFNTYVPGENNKMVKVYMIKLL